MERCRVKSRGTIPGKRYTPSVLKGIFYAFLASSLLLSTGASAARRGRLAGRVYDLTTGKPVAEAIVSIQGTDISTLTDSEGKFHIDLEEGTYGISILKQDYYNTLYQDIEIEGGQVTTYKCELVPGNPSQVFFFSIGGITVLDKRELIPENIETTHTITSDEIEHQLSTNLGDILTLIPGVERTEVPGLSEKSQVELRGTGNMPGTEEKTAALFGTKVIVDDITISNNANLQSGPGTATAVTSTTAGSGIDLRTIPADNIEKVEVVTGVPSVEYGDMTTGIVKVQTKMGRQPIRLKLKSNPDTKEANLIGGHMLLGNTGFTYNLNYAWSERDIRREGDEYARYDAQLTTKSKWKGGDVSFLNKFQYNGLLDEYNLDPSDPLAMWQYNKDWTFIYGNTVDYKPTKDTKLEWRANLKYTKRDSYSQKLVGADTRVLTDAMETGTQEGVLKVGAYVYKIWTKGEEYNFSGKLNFRYDFNALRFDHSLLAGGEYTYDDNVGVGKIYNPFEPPYGNPGYRPVPFDDVPALQTANFYMEDEISGFWRMQPYSINLGFRYEMYTPFKLHLGNIFGKGGVVESKNGTYLNPRVRLKYSLFKDTQVRFSWGKSSKMPSMTNIWQGAEYYDVIDENVTPPDSVPLVSTYVYNYDNTHLLGYQSEKLEGSLDQKIGSVGLSLTGFYDEGRDIPRDINSPVTLHRYRWENYPDDPPIAIDTIYTTNGGSHGYYRSVGWFEKYGLEFEIRTRRIEKISTSFYVTASFVKSRSGANGTYMSSPSMNMELGRTIYPFYHYSTNWRQKLIVNYNADWFIKKAGMWITFFLQQTLYDQNKKLEDYVTHSVGYYDPLIESYVPITPERSDEIGLTRHPSETDIGVFKRPNDRFLFNVNVSKSLGRGAEVSFFVHNIFDDPAWYLNEYENWSSRNHEIFYGVQFSMILDYLFQKPPETEGVR